MCSANASDARLLCSSLDCPHHVTRRACAVGSATGRTAFLKKGSIFPLASGYPALIAFLLFFATFRLYLPAKSPLAHAEPTQEPEMYDSKAPMQDYAKHILFGLCLSIVVVTATAQNGSQSSNAAYVPDKVLLADHGAPWTYTSRPSQLTVTVNRRDPNPAEQRVIERARLLLESREAKAIALIDGANIVYLEYKAPATDQSLFTSMSIAKTVTSIGIGQAICATKLKLTDRASDILPDLKDKALGKATVRDLLMMASGAANPSDSGSSTLMTSQNWRDWSAGTYDLADLIRDERVAGPARGVFSDYKPGETFVYKQTDPVVLGLMLNSVTAMPYTKWIQESVFDPMGMARQGWIEQNKKQQALADQGIWLSMEDWVRFAIWVKQASVQKDCLGDYIREASRTQIWTDRKGGSYLSGYGYLIWTANVMARDTFWAAGKGGQRIGWTNNSNRMIVVFSNREDWMTDLYGLFVDWKNIDR